VARPIYQNVKMEALNGDVHLSATDLEVGIRIKAQGAIVEQEGVVLVPAGRVSSILGATPDETVALSGDESSVTIHSSDGVFRMVAENAEGFVDVPSLAADAAMEVDPEVLQYMVRHTIFAAADERGRYALNGVLVVVDEKGAFEMAAADGARLANVRKKLSNPATQSVDCIVMKKGLEQAARLAALSDKPLKMQVTETQFLVENEAGRLCCQLVEGQFPNYREVIPKDCKMKVELSTRPLLNALTRAAFLTSEQTRAVNFTFTKNLLTLTSQSPDVGEAEVRMPTDYQGEETSIAFNPTYIEEMLKTVGRESVKFEFNDGRTPCVLRSGTDYTYVVSPVVKEE
jgi:DNA polymerase-3 subunit beta